MATYRYSVKVKGSAEVCIDANSNEGALEEIRASVGVGLVSFGELPCGTRIMGSAQMSDEPPELLDVTGDDVAVCQNCEGRWAEEDLQEVKHLTLRVLPGEPMPSGECPTCGALCQPVDPGSSSKALLAIK